MRGMFLLRPGFKLLKPLLRSGFGQGLLIRKGNEFHVFHDGGAILWTLSPSTLSTLPATSHSAFGYEPSTFTKLHCSASIVRAFATFRSSKWPSQSTKKKYSHALRLLGRDSILVMLMRKR